MKVRKYNSCNTPFDIFATEPLVLRFHSQQYIVVSICLLFDCTMQHTGS